MPERYADLSVHRERSGRQDRWNDALAAPKPSSVYVVDERYLYATVTGPDGRQAQVDPLPEGLEDQFETLRLQMYQQGKGAWLTAVNSIAAEGRFSTDFDYDNEPNWSIPVSPDT